jgi:hypothetical protein
MHSPTGASILYIDSRRLACRSPKGAAVARSLRDQRYCRVHAGLGRGVVAKAPCEPGALLMVSVPLVHIQAPVGQAPTAQEITAALAVQMLSPGELDVLRAMASSSDGEAPAAALLPGHCRPAPPSACSQTLPQGCPTRKAAPCYLQGVLLLTKLQLLMCHPLLPAMSCHSRPRPPAAAAVTEQAELPVDLPAPAPGGGTGSTAAGAVLPVDLLARIVQLNCYSMEQQDQVGGQQGQQAAGSRQQAAGSRQQAAGSRQQAAGSRQQAAGSRQQAAGVPSQALGCVMSKPAPPSAITPVQHDNRPPAHGLPAACLLLFLSHLHSTCTHCHHAPPPTRLPAHTCTTPLHHACMPPPPPWVAAATTHQPHHTTSQAYTRQPTVAGPYPYPDLPPLPPPSPPPQVAVDIARQPLHALGGVWPEFSMLNHSCAPTTVVVPLGDRLLVRAARREGLGAGGGREEACCLMQCCLMQCCLIQCCLMLDASATLHAAYKSWPPTPAHGTTCDHLRVPTPPPLPPHRRAGHQELPGQ